jgi:hypothetical protein
MLQIFQKGTLIHLFFDYMFQVDLPVQQSFLWYRSSEGDASDSQVLLRDWLFSVKRKNEHMFDSFNVCVSC